MGWLWSPPCVLRTVIVNLKSDADTGLRGVLWSSRRGWFVLRQAHVVKAHAEPVPIDGEVIIERENVAFLQVLP